MLIILIFLEDSLDIGRDVAESAINVLTLAKCDIQQILQTDQCEFKRNFALRSEIFFISCLDPNPVKIKMQHCAVVPSDDRNPSLNLKFMVCKDPGSKPPYKFEVHDGYFTQGLQAPYGDTEVPPKCIVAICQKVECSYFHPDTFTLDHDRCYGKKYFAALYINEENEYKTEACFAVCQNLEGKKKVQNNPCKKLMIMNNNNNNKNS